MTVLYRFFDAEGRLLYVGVASNPVIRWQVHRGGTHWWRTARNITLEHYDSRREAEEAERRAISEERPRFNRANATPAGAPTRERAVYRQIVRDIQESIASGELAEGAKLPSISELCRTYGVSVTPVKFAWKIMQMEGVIETRQGVGAFVAGKGDDQS